MSNSKPSVAAGLGASVEWRLKKEKNVVRGKRCQSTGDRSTITGSLPVPSCVSSSSLSLSEASLFVRASRRVFAREICLHNVWGEDEGGKRHNFISIISSVSFSFFCGEGARTKREFRVSHPLFVRMFCMTNLSCYYAKEQPRILEQKTHLSIKP